MRTFLGSVRPTHVLALPFALLLLGSDCAATDDCYPFEDGDQLAVLLVEPYDEDSITRYRPGGVGDTGGVPSCEGFDGLVPGVRLDLDVGPRVESAGCEAYEVSLVSEVPPLEGQVTGPFGVTGTIVTSDGCTGEVSVDFLIGAEEPFGPVIAGEEPPVIVEREFRTTEVDTCPMFPPDTGRYLCIDVFVATLEMR